MAQFINLLNCLKILEVLFFSLSVTVFLLLCIVFVHLYKALRSGSVPRTAMYSPWSSPIRTCPPTEFVTSPPQEEIMPVIPVAIPSRVTRRRGIGRIIPNEARHAPQGLLRLPREDAYLLARYNFIMEENRSNRNRYELDLLNAFRINGNDRNNENNVEGA